MTESKCRKDKDHDLWFGTWPPAEFRRVSMRRLSHWRRQQQHLLQWLQALGAQKCSGLKRLTKDPDYRCTRCWGTACPLDGRPQKKVQVRPDKLAVVASFCYLGDMLSAAGGCEFSTTTCVKTAWKKFKDLLPVLSSRHLSFKTRGRVYSFCTVFVRGAQCSMPAGLGHWQSQTSSVCSEMTGQWSNRSAMSGRNTLSPPGPMSYLPGLALRILIILKERWLRWYGHVERSNGALSALTAFHIQVEGKHGPGRPKMTQKQLTERDCREWKLSAINPHDRNMWRSGVRSAMRAAS